MSILRIVDMWIKLKLLVGKPSYMKIAERHVRSELVEYMVKNLKNVL